MKTWYNVNFIERLKELGITSIILLTRMDAKRYSVNSPIRLPLINFLASQGITVKHVLTPLDMLFKNAGHENFHPGDAYQKYMLPVEEAIVRIKSIPEDVFRKYNYFLASDMILKALKFIRKIIDGTTPVSSLEELIEMKKDEIDTYIFNNFHYNINDCDYCTIFEGLTNCINYHKDKLDSFDNLISALEIQIQDQSQTLPVLSDEDHNNIFTFSAEIIKYRNLQYHAYLTVYKKIAEKAITDDGKEKELGQSGQSSLGYTKGDIYAWFIEENPLNKDDLVVFVDDNKKEHTSLLDSHSKEGFSHHLVTSMPPWSNQGFNLTISKEEFNNFTFECHFQHDLHMHLNGRQIDEETRESYIKNFNNRGILEVENKNYIAALYYFQIAFLFCNNNPASKKEQEMKSFLVSHIIQVKDDYTQNYTDTLKFDNSELDNLWRNLNVANGFAMEIKMVHLAVMAHKAGNPFFYNYFTSALSFIKSEVDSDFKSKIVGQVMFLASIYPDKKISCFDFLESLCKEVCSSKHITYIKEALDQLHAVAEEKEKELKI